MHDKFPVSPDVQPLALAKRVFAEENTSTPPQPANPLTLTLASEFRNVTPDQPFYVGLWLEHPEGYHTYWMSPGIVGVPTHIKWDLPAGITAGPILWPPPERVSMLGINAHGYHGRQLLMVRMETDASLLKGEEFNIKGLASWMCCGRTCHPGFKELSLTLPVALANKIRENPEWKERFEAARAALPVEDARWKATAKTGGQGFLITLEPAAEGLQAPQGDVYFFSGNGLIQSDVPQIVTRQGNQLILSLAREKYASKTSIDMEGLLWAEKGWDEEGKRHYLPVKTVIAGEH